MDVYYSNLCQYKDFMSVLQSLRFEQEAFPYKVTQSFEKEVQTLSFENFYTETLFVVKHYIGKAGVDTIISELMRNLEAKEKSALVNRKQFQLYASRIPYFSGLMASTLFNYVDFYLEECFTV